MEPFIIPEKFNNPAAVRRTHVARDLSPFRLSRNPIYLGMASILLGVAEVLGTLVALAFPVIFIALIEFCIIPGEERKLENLFGEPYREYKKSVRRWI